MSKLLILFGYGGRRYRMRVAEVHIHPGERDRIEQSSRDMLGSISWNSLPDSSNTVPSPEWLIRKALWQQATSESLPCDNSFMIDLGDL